MDEHVCVFEPILAECLCGRILTIGELCKRANATERLSADAARYMGEYGIENIAQWKSLLAYANILEGKCASG